MSFKVDPESVMQCSSRLKQIQQHAAGIMTLAKDANPEWYIWGLVGAPFAAIYWSYASGLYQHLEQMGEALKDRIDSLDGCVDNYAATEKAMTDALNGIKNLLG
jgi:hypothetical protein